jgi:G3E family GTPase
MTPGIILNELGEVNVEKHLFRDMQLIELLNGCICCTIQDDLTKELAQFIQTTLESRQSLDLLIIEGTGVANPIEIVEALTHPSLIDRVDIKSIISLVDASQFLEYQSIFSSSKEIRTILKDQVAHSSLILLNKVDLISESKLAKVKKKLSQLIDVKTQVIETKFGQVDLKELLQSRMETITIHSHHEHGSSKHKGHHHTHLDHVFQTLKIDSIEALNRKNFERWVQGLPESVLRAKGIAQFEDTGNWYHFQFSSRKLHISDLRREEVPTRFSNIIIIGTNLPIDEIEASFEKQCLLKSNVI